MKITADIQCVETGEVRRFDGGEHEMTEDGVAWQWTEGNFGCDCNRRLFFARAGGDEVEFGDVCGNTGFRARVFADGEVVVDELDDPEHIAVTQRN